MTHIIAVVNGDMHVYWNRWRRNEDEDHVMISADWSKMSVARLLECLLGVRRDDVPLAARAWRLDKLTEGSWLKTLTLMNTDLRTTAWDKRATYVKSIDWLVMRSHTWRCDLIDGESFFFHDVKTLAAIQARSHYTIPWPFPHSAWIDGQLIQHHCQTGRSTERRLRLVYIMPNQFWRNPPCWN